MAGVLLFQFVIVGIGEEVFFRGFLLGALQPLLPARHRWGPLDISSAGLATAVIFGLEHGLYFGHASLLEVTFNPAWPQVIYATALGVYYAALRERTRSLLGPIVSHGLSDGTLVLMTYLALAATGWPSL